MRLSERISQGSTSNLLENINTNLKESNNDVDLDENTLTEDIDTFDEFKAGVENASSLYNFIYNEFGTMSKELLKEIALDAIYHLKNDEVIINDIKERFFNVYESEEPEKRDTEVKDNETNLNESNMASKYAKFCKSMELDPKDLDAVLEALDNLEGMDGDASGEYQEIREYIYNDLMK